MVKSVVDVWFGQDFWDLIAYTSFQCAVLMLLSILGPSVFGERLIRIPCWISGFLTAQWPNFQDIALISSV